MSSVYLHIHSNDVADGASECGALPPHPQPKVQKSAIAVGMSEEKWEKSESASSCTMAATGGNNADVVGSGGTPQGTVAVVGRRRLWELNKRIGA